MCSRRECKRAFFRRVTMRDRQLSRCKKLTAPNCGNLLLASPQNADTKKYLQRARERALRKLAKPRSMNVFALEVEFWPCFLCRGSSAADRYGAPPRSGIGECDLFPAPFGHSQ